MIRFIILVIQGRHAVLTTVKVAVAVYNAYKEWRRATAAKQQK